MASVRFLWEEQGGRCWYCKQPVRSREATIDHVRPKSKGGTNKRNNLVMAHPKCNFEKADKLTNRTKTLTRVNELRALSGLEPMTEIDAMLGWGERRKTKG